MEPEHSSTSLCGLGKGDKLLEGYGVGEEGHIQLVSLECLEHSSMCRRQIDICVSRRWKRGGRR